MSESSENQEQNQQTVHPHETKMSFKQKARLVFMTLLTIFLVIFIVQNSNYVELQFLNAEFKVRIIYLILVSALIGGLVTFLMLKIREARKRKKQG